MEKFNIVLVVSDTFRGDHLPCYGNHTVIAPNISSLAEKSLIFDNFYAGSFPTVPARADIMTGKYTFTYMGWEPLPQKEITLAASLTESGLLTTGIVDTPFLVRNGYGYDRGFQDFIWMRGQRSGPEHDDVVSLRVKEEDYFAPRTFKTAIDWLERHHQEHFFLYIDTWDPHEPWDPPAYYVKPYYPDYAGEMVNPNYWNWKEDNFTEKDLAIAHACYCGEITMVDRWLGLFMDRLKTLGLSENTIIIFTSDHGFYFGEHNLFGKTRFRWPGNVGFEDGFIKGYKMGDQFSYRSPLHREVSHIPLIIHVPGADHKRINGVSSIPDLTPTILELANAPIPNTVKSKSLMPLIRGDVNKIHDFAVTSAPLEPIGVIQKIVDDQPRKVVELSPSTITNGEWDMLYSISGEPIELYDAQKDPKHTKDISKDKQDVVKMLHGSYVKWLREMDTPEDRLTNRLEL
jgi:arylsulfatase A-like enzyme